jgi:transcriptional regulator with AAA-type ATPase domain
MQPLDRDRSREAGVADDLSEVDRRHPPRGDFLVERVSADPLHLGECSIAPMPRARAPEGATTLTTIHRRRASVPTLELVAQPSSASSPTVSCPLGLAPVIVGTSEECDLVVDDHGVSRRHCSFALTTNGVLVTDLESKNGTVVGGIEVREGFLTSTSFARVGGTTLRLRVAGEATEVPLWPGVRFGLALGGSIVMRALFERLHQAAATDETVLLTGESGTGKELLAHALYQESARREGPFVIFDAGSVTPALVESELFGHVAGAFTGAAFPREGLLAEAHGGTLFLDEIGELPLDLQPRLLRALESREFRPVGANTMRSFDARIVAATHRDLRAAVRAGTFRQDLFYRLAVVEARVPALRERKDDIELLVESFLAAEIPPRTLLDLPDGSLALLGGHDWPGNVRELRNTVARLALFPERPDAAIDLGGTEGAARASFDALLALPWREARERVIDRFEASYVQAKLRKHDGSAADAAAAMGISRQMFYRLMSRHGLTSGAKA